MRYHLLFMQILNILLKEQSNVKTNLKKHPQKKIGEHIPCQYSMHTIWTFYSTENKHDVYRSEDVTKKFCERLREHAVKIINFEKKKMIPLTR